MSNKTKNILEALNETLKEIKDLEGYEAEGMLGPGELDSKVLILSLKLQEKLATMAHCSGVRFLIIQRSISS